MKKYLSLSIAAIALMIASLGIYSCTKNDSGGVNSVAPNTGVGGSLARFTISGNYLYVVDHQNLVTFDISNAGNPVQKSITLIGFEIETIFPYKDKLFIGSQQAMYIYSIAKPGEPVFLSQATHVRACDPVVANDSVAYVTVRSGSDCGGDINALFAYNFENCQYPVEMSRINLTNPMGLGLQDSTLFVCDNDQLKVYSLENDFYNPRQIATISGETFYDCIPYDDILICMIKGGTAIYDISDRNNIKQISTITE